jgi:hypothetical protein
MPVPRKPSADFRQHNKNEFCFFYLEKSTNISGNVRRKLESAKTKTSTHKKRPILVEKECQSMQAYRGLLPQSSSSLVDKAAK